MAIEHKYQVALEWNDARKGILSSDVLHDKIEVATPPEFPQGMPGIWSPEHLLVAAASSCLMTTFLAIAEHSKLNFHSFQVQAEGKLEEVEGKLMISEILLLPRVEITHELDREKAERILRKSEANCLISRSLNARVHMQTQVLTPTESAMA
ncbi:MAG: OsmC family protein [Bacteroidetes bacterium]|nr:OsmC family protein [Bacteroidota bacterium]MBS1630495.1 OsmC family protein [Bacteroidota bacterium]